jgi:hypothetical protein
MTNAVFTARNAAVLALGTFEAPLEVTSAWIDDQLAYTYNACGVRPGLLENVAGIKSRRWWPEGTTFDHVALHFKMLVSSLVTLTFSSAHRSVSTTLNRRWRHLCIISWVCRRQR